MIEMSQLQAANSEGSGNSSGWSQVLVSLVEESQGCCHVLMQKSEKDGPEDEVLRQLCVLAGVKPQSIALPNLPEQLHPFLLKFDLRYSLHWQALDVLHSLIQQDISFAALEQGRMQRVCAFIISGLDNEDVAHVIKRAAIAPSQLPGKRRWLRFYDPVVATSFWPILDEKQVSSLLHGIYSWAFVDVWQQLQVIKRPSLRSSSQTHLSLQLTTGQWHQLQSVGAVHQAWLRARREGLPADHMTHQNVIAALRQVHDQGVRSRLDMDYFARQAFQYGHGFFRHPEVEALLQRLNSEHDYVGLAHEIEPAQWRRISNEVGQWSARKAI